MNLQSFVRAKLVRLLGNKTASDEKILALALRILAKYQSRIVQDKFVRTHGVGVMAGPLAGLEFFPDAIEGCHIAKLLGCYEQELHPFLLTLPQSDYQVVLNIGCAEGYYAVGIARLVPGAEVHAFDINVTAQKACVDLAQRNGVNVKVAGRFAPVDFAAFADRRVLVWCDIEGGEADLLNPVEAPALKQMDIVVELHPSIHDDILDVMRSRFQGTHDIEVIQNQILSVDLPPILRNADHLDQLLALWEWRESPTPWLIMYSRCARELPPDRSKTL